MRLIGALTRRCARGVILSPVRARDLLSGNRPNLHSIIPIKVINSMAEPISLASGLLTLSAFAFKSSVTLYETIQSFRNHPKNVRDLNNELVALNGFLDSLTETVNVATDVDLSALSVPLLRCGNACKEFEQQLLKCSSRSGGNGMSLRGWAQLRYMGDGIDNFRNMLAGYKSTIAIALNDANL